MICWKLLRFHFLLNRFCASMPGGVPDILSRNSCWRAKKHLTEEDTIDQNQLLGTSGQFYFGALFQDRVCLEPWGWGSIIANALAASGEDAAAMD